MKEDNKTVNIKKTVYTIIKIVAFLLILFFCIQTVHNITKRKNSYLTKQDFFKQEENFDVLFFGSSRIWNSVFPMQLWNDYGIVSYNLGNSSETIAISYYNMLLALEHTKPKVVVIEPHVNFEDKINKEKKEHLHNALDAYPLSYTKYLAIKDLFDNEDMLNNTAEFLFNFSIYHSRWDEVTKNDFKESQTYEKGALSKINVAVPDKINDFDSVEMYNKSETINMKYLRKIIEYCQQNGIEVLVTYIPFPSATGYIARSKYIGKICDEYDVNYINFLGMDIVNYDSDCYDERSHLNPSGARKVTDYIGNYIMEHYDVQDQRENKNYEFWYQDYDEYVDYKIRKLKENEENLNNYIMLLYGEKDIKYEIKISSHRKIEKNSILYKVLENIDNNYQIDDTAFEENKDKTIKITIYDNRDGSEIDTVWW